MRSVGRRTLPYARRGGPRVRWAEAHRGRVPISVPAWRPTHDPHPASRPLPPPTPVTPHTRAAALAMGVSTGSRLTGPTRPTPSRQVHLRRARRSTWGVARAASSTTLPRRPWTRVRCAPAACKRDPHLGARSMLRRSPVHVNHRPTTAALPPLSGATTTLTTRWRDLLPARYRLRAGAELGGPWRRGVHQDGE